MLRTLLIGLCLAVFGAPLSVSAATAPDFYLPTDTELPPGVQLQQADGVRPVGINGGLEETRIYSSSQPLAVLGVTVSVLDGQMAPQRYASGLSAYIHQGYGVSRPNNRTEGVDVELTQTGPELTRHVRFLLVGSVIGTVTVLFNNATASSTDAAALAESIAAPLLLKMLANPDGL